ncbi:MAG: response regulator [Phycisphaerae bacterium]
MQKKLPLILLIDDDPDFTAMNKLMLESNGYRILCTHDSREALKKMAEDKPSLVITDLMMQNLDSGFAFSRQMKQDPRFKDIPVIILTSVSSQHGFDFHPRSGEELSAMNADAFFEKPISSKILLKKVEELIKRNI